MLEFLINPKIITLIIFILTYLGLIFFPKKRLVFAGAGAILIIIFGIINFSEIFSVIDWNILLMIFGTSGLVILFSESKMPAFLGEKLIEKAPNFQWAIVFLSLLSGFISAFLENVSTLLILAPVALSIAKKLKVSPVPLLITIAISSNLQGAATLIGDPTSIMLGSYANLNFLEFFFLNGKPGMFFAVEIGALASALIIYFLFRKEKQPIKTDEFTKVTDFFPTILILLMILSLICVSFIKEKPSLTNGLICLIFFVIGIIRDLIVKKDFSFNKILKNLNCETLALLFFIFIIIGAVVKVGIVSDIASILVSLGKGKIFLLYSIIVWGSVLASAFIDNIPYVATMLPVISSLTAKLGISPYLFYFGLLSGATLGGNITPIGASTNITALNILKKEGYTVSFKEFAKYSVPLTLAAVTSGYLFIWFVWS
ncbi:MAG TPA: SLC13 family permease [Candidatus Pacearchaeota archaeon]|nr:SLC13 family permease [Candidatus Pacearchaeota archaeon]